MLQIVTSCFRVRALHKETMGANVRKVAAGCDLEPFVPVRLGTLANKIFRPC